MTIEDNKAILRRLIDDAFNGRDLDVLDEVLHPEFVNHQEVFPLEAKTGPDVFRELYGKFFKAFPDIRAAYHNIIAEGDLVMAQDTITGTNTGSLPIGAPATNKAVSFEVFHLYRVQDGKLIERWGLTDDLTLMKQLGVIDV